jgi:hypothetical protein
VSRAGRSRLVVHRPGTPGIYMPVARAGWDVIGTVELADDIGALIRNQRTGIYCCAIGGLLRSLPQHKVIAALAATGRGDES